MSWFRNTFGATMGFFLAGSLFLLLFGIVGGTGFLYLRQQTIVQDEAAVQRKESRDVNAYMEALTAFERRRLDDMRDLIIKQYGLEEGNEIHERLLDLAQRFPQDTYYDIGHMVFEETKRRSKADAVIKIPSLLYELQVRAMDAPPQRFVPFLAANVEVYALATQQVLKIDPTSRNPYEGEDTTPMSVNTYYRESTDPETGENISKRRTLTPGYHYEPQAPGKDPGYNSRRATAPLR